MTPTKQITEPQAIAKAIAYTENGGKPNLSNPSAGKSGEMKSIFQFTPDTWAKDSEQVFGKSGVPLTNDTEGYVAVQKIDNWLKQGYTPSQIFSMWNAGIGEPNAYTGKFSNGESSTGTNKEGVPYSVKSYVDKANNYLAEFMPQVQGETNQENTPESTVATNTSPQQGQSQASQVSPEQYKNSIATIVDLVKKGQSKQSPPSGGLLSAAPTPQVA